ncbi:MAG: putative transport system permease protein [Ilumatobacteraceae bacterium]|jgi:ABC-type antimicrobial peptide transport system permease subunit
MNAVLYRLRSVLRTRWPATLAMTLVVALVGGVVIAFAAGAQRTVTAPERYTAAWGGEFDGVVTQEEGGPPRVAEVSSLPGVESSESFTFVFGGITRADSPESVPSALVFVGTPGALGVHLISGRLPDPTSINEFAASRTFVAGNDIALGDTFELVTFTQEQGDNSRFGVDPPAGPHFPVTLVGIVDGPTTLEDQTPAAVFSRVLLNTPNIGVSQTKIAVNLRPGVGLEEFRSQLDSLPESGTLSLAFTPLISSQLRRAVNTQGRGLWLLAVVAGIAAVAVLGQVITRQARLAAIERLPLSALGFTDRQVLLESTCRAAVPIVVGTVLGAIFALMISGIFPTGFIRALEPHPGVLVLWGVLLAATGVLVTALLAWTLTSLVLPRWTTRAVRPSPTLDAVSRRVGSPTAAVGLRFAFMRSADERGSTRASLVGVLLTVCGLVGAITFGVSLDRLVNEPFRYGVNFDASFGDNGGNQLPDGFRERLDADSNITSLALYAGSQARVGGTTVPLLGVEAVRGNGAPIVLTGRFPTADDEIAFGRVSGSDVGARVGGDVTMTGPTGSQTFHVVGLVVVPGLGANEGIGEGAVVTLGGLSRVDQKTQVTSAAVNFRSRSVAFNDYGSEFGLTSEPTPGFKPAAITNVARVRAIPFALAAVLAVLVVLTVAHIMFTSTRARRRDLAILRALGADRGWVTRAVHWQATTFTIVPLVVGVPLGFIIGRIVFAAFANSMGAINDASLPIEIVIVVVAGVLILANLVAAIPARRARRMRPALILQTD